METNQKLDFERKVNCVILGCKKQAIVLVKFLNKKDEEVELSLCEDHQDMTSYHFYKEFPLRRKNDPSKK